MNIKETFKIIPFATRYEVSNFGNVRNIKTRRIIKASKITKGYMSLAIFSDVHNKSVSFKVHRLVAETFLNKKKGLVIDHIDNDKSNNNLENLKYVTNRYNIVKQKLYSSKGFVRNNNTKTKSSYTIEYRKNHKRYLFTHSDKMECIKHYCQSIKDIDLSVVKLLAEYYGL